jgi:hypothetical protein
MVELENDLGHCRRRLGERLREPAPGHIQLLTGPRQVGKTTLLLELAREFGGAAIYMAGDEPDAALPGFWERCWTEAEARAQHGTAVLFWTRYITCLTGRHASRDNGTACAVGICRCTWLRPVPPHCAWPRDRARAWPDASSE